MTGPLFLGGGGSDSDERLLWLEMLDAQPRHVLYWPLALPEDQRSGAEGWLRQAFERLDAQVRLAAWNSLADRDRSELAQFDLLFVGGGNTFRLLPQVQEHDFLEPVRDFVHTGGAYYGGSAGAVLACSDIGIAIGRDRQDVELTDLTALGLLGGVAVLPHYEGTQQASAQAYAREHNCEVIAVPEQSGLVVRADQIRVSGPAPVWTISDAQVIERKPGESWPTRC